MRVHSKKNNVMKNILVIVVFFAFGFSLKGQSSKPVDDQKVELYREIGISNYWEFNFSVTVSKLSYVLRYNKDDHEAYYYRGLAKGNQGAFASAIKDFDKAIELHQGNVDYYYKRAQSYFEMRKYEKAIFAFEESINKAQALNQTDNLPIMYYELAMAQVEVKNLPAACQALEKADQLGLVNAKRVKKRTCKGRD